MRGLSVTLQDTAPERIAPAVKRAAELFKRRLRDERRVRDALDRLVPDVAGDGARHADVIIEAIFENLDAKRAVDPSPYAFNDVTAANQAATTGAFEPMLRPNTAPAQSSMYMGVR